MTISPYLECQHVHIGCQTASAGDSPHLLLLIRSDLGVQPRAEAHTQTLLLAYPDTLCTLNQESLGHFHFVLGHVTYLLENVREEFNVEVDSHHDKKQPVSEADIVLEKLKSSQGKRRGDCSQVVGPQSSARQ